MTSNSNNSKEQANVSNFFLFSSPPFLSVSLLDLLSLPLCPTHPLPPFPFPLAPYLPYSPFPFPSKPHPPSTTYPPCAEHQGGQCVFAKWCDGGSRVLRRAMIVTDRGRINAWTASKVTDRRRDNEFLAFFSSFFGFLFIILTLNHLIMLLLKSMDLLLLFIIN